mmetsp:Transcript_21747/g.20866  ORF Transcript_21747/g.20866 Transcript_21747/m.20866 type:complete len:378 (+) Transcript_21747:443-1576(+)
MQELAYPYDTFTTSVLDHTFIERCSEIANLVPLYFIMSGLWALITIFWIYLVMVRMKHQTLYLQKILMLFPICKALETMINGFFAKDCPWTSQTDTSEKYVEMARISIVTISYTIFLAILYLMSKGWNTIMFQMSRSQATYLTMIMGGVYLAYSAYFLSNGFTGVLYFMLAVMILMYALMGIVNSKNIIQCIKLLQSFITQSNNDEIVDTQLMLPQLKLKKSILIKFLFITMGYYLLKVVLYMIFAISKNQIANWKFAAFVSAMDFVFFGGILLVFRPRVWPQFYTLNLNELQNNLAGEADIRNEGNPRSLPLLISLVIDHDIIDKDKECIVQNYSHENTRTNSIDSFGEGDAIFVMNPNEYTIQDFEKDYETYQPE